MSNRSLWSQLVVGVASIVIAATLVAIYGRMDSLTVSMAVVQVQLAELRASKEQYQTHAEAKAAISAVWRTDKDQYARIEDHEQRLRKVERR